LLRTSIQIALIVMALGCERPADLVWQIEAEAGVDTARVVRVIAAIRATSCSSEELLYTGEATMGAATPPTLSPGRYAFEAVAVDDSCTPIASDCVEVRLPLADGDTLSLLLQEEGAPALCEPAACNDGFCGSVDAGGSDSAMDSAVDSALDAPRDADAPPDVPVDTAPDVVYTYAWRVAPGCGACSVTCGGGTCPLDVFCERDDAERVADSFCTDTRPPDTQSCNTDPCCSTDSLSMSNARCSGTTSDIISWDPDHYGLDDGSAANRAMCQAQCTAWAGSRSGWCCDLTEDSTTGTNWICAAHTGTTIVGYSHGNSRGAYAGLGRCR